MTVEQFILIYKTKKDDQKEGYIKEHIVNKYIPYTDKISICQNIINHTMYSNEEGRKKFSQNTPLKFLFFILTMIKEYTDLEINFKEDFLKSFDTLNQYGLIDIIRDNIPQSEYIEFNTLMDMLIDDIMMNERDLPSFIETNISLLRDNIQTIMESLNLEE